MKLRVLTALALFAAAGCDAGDPCSGKTGAHACVALTVEGPAALFTALRVDVQGAGRPLQAQTMTAPFHLPVQLALLLPPDVAVAGLRVDVSGVEADQTQLAAGAPVVAASPHVGSATVTLAPITADGGADAALDSGADAAPDLAPPPNLTIAPPAYTYATTLAGGQQRLAVFTLTNHSTSAVTINTITVDAMYRVLIGAGLCAQQMTLGPSQSCTLNVNFEPNARGLFAATLRADTTTGDTATSALTGKSVAWSLEPTMLSMDAGALPTIGALWIDGVQNGYALDSNGRLLGRAGAGVWQPRASIGAAPLRAALWAAGNEIWATDGSTSTGYYSASGGTVVAPFTVAGASGALRAVWGSSATQVYLTTNNGQILVGSGTTFALAHDAGNGANFEGMFGAGSDRFAAGTTTSGVVEIFSGTWGTPVVVGPYRLHGIWGNSATDYYVAGECIPPGCSYLAHGNGAGFTQQGPSGASAFVGVWGAASDVFAINATGEVWHNDGSGVWTPESLPLATAVPLAAVAGAVGANGVEVWVGGAGGTILHRY